MGRHTSIATVTPRLVDATTAAAFLGRGRTRFLEQVSAGLLPQPSDKNGNVDLWDLRMLDRYVDQCSGLGTDLGAWD